MITLTAWEAIALVAVVMGFHLLNRLFAECEDAPDFNEVGGGTVEAKSDDDDARLLGFRRK